MNTPSPLRLAEHQMQAAIRREPYVYRGRVEEAWRMLQRMYFQAHGTTPEKVAELALRTMTAFARMPDADVRVLAQPDQGWTQTGVGEHVAGEKRKVLEKHADIVEYQAAVDKWAEQVRRSEQQVIDERQAAYDAGAPSRLLARLRKIGVHLAVAGDKLTVPAGSGLSAADREEIVQHKAALVGLLKVEAEASKPLVIA